ncbi:MAG: TetR/AcrR family transcriptional regulator [Acidobacteria bacterium]|nr:TetR/AcrR family transcriptional regulator [Acidobacteriota bacterium]
MNQEERTQRSRAAILDAALALFATQGYRATSMRDVARKALVSIGNVYHHFEDKETIFRELLDVFWRVVETPDFPVTRALTEGTFPENLEALGHAAQESIAKYRPYVRLIYVDVVEFEGSHIRKFYSEMASLFGRFVEGHRDQIRIEGKLRRDIPPAEAIMFVFRTYLQHFAVELVFGVPDLYGKNTGQIVREMSDIMRNGLLQTKA